MRNSLRRLCSAVLLLSGYATFANAADEFAAPPKAERDLVAAVAKGGGRATVDGDYRVTALTLGADCTNDHVKALAACERLTQLSVSSRNITDDSLESLKGLTKLTQLTIMTSGISTEGVAALRTALPNARVTSFGGSRGPGGGGAAGRPAGGETADRERSGRGGSSTAGPPGGFGGFGSANRRGLDLLRNIAIQDDLKLSDDQRDKASFAKLNAAVTALQKSQEEQALAALTPAQQARLTQLEFQQLGVQAFLRADMAKLLEITDEQQASIRKLADEATAAGRTAMTDAFRQRTEGGQVDTAKMQEQLAALAKTHSEKILAVLNEKQRDAWKAITGPPGPTIGSPFSVFSSRATGSGPIVGGGPGGGSPGGGGPGGGFPAPALPSNPAEAAKAYFDRYDRDNDGKLTDVELSPTGRARTGMAAAGIELKFPASREEFEKAYGTYLAGNIRIVPVNSDTIAKAIVTLIDKDGDGSITEAEFPAGNRTRESLTRAGGELKLPISREDLEKALLKQSESTRPRE